MPQTSSRKLPPRVARELDNIASELFRILNGQGEPGRAVKAADNAARAAWAEAERAGHLPDTASGETLDGFGAVIARRIKEIRDESGWSQTELAAVMAKYFKWTRITVAEVELRKRRVTLEELAVLAGLFAVPIAEFMVPVQPVRLRLGAIALSSAQVSELLVGPGTSVGTGGLSWTTSARVATKVKERPAADLWTARAARHTQPSSSTKPTRARAKKEK